MKEEREVIEEVIDTTVEEEETIEEQPEKKENIFKRGFTAVKRGVKKHPKLTAALTLLVVGGISYALGTKVKQCEDHPDDNGDEDLNLIDYDEEDDSYDEEETFDEEDVEESEEEEVV